jgi:hypothetical protein
VRRAFLIVACVAASLTVGLAWSGEDPPKKEDPRSEKAGQKEAAEEKDRSSGRAGDEGKAAKDGSDDAASARDATAEDASAPVDPELRPITSEEARERRLSDLPREPGAKSGSPVIVITNEDLARYSRSGRPRSGSASSPTPDRPRGATSPSRRGASGSKKDDAAVSAETASGGVPSSPAKIDEELERLRARARSISNPYLPRVERTEEEQAAEKGLDNRERLDRVRARIAELEKARARSAKSDDADER